MKKVVIFTLIAVFLAACEKKEKIIPEAEVSFSISELMDGFKTGGCPDCPADEGVLLEPDYLEITINETQGTISGIPGGTPGDVVHKLNVFRVNGQLYTQTLKLGANENGTPKDYYLKSFLLYNNGPNSNVDTDDVLIRAIPEAGSLYAGIVSRPVEMSLSVGPFEKLQIDAQVLCFMPGEYLNFGFSWFAITQTVVREFCFFGDICLNDDPWTPDDFQNSFYDTDLTNLDLGVGVDVPAIMNMIVRRNGVEVAYNPFTNLDNSDQMIPGPLCVRYPDILNVPDEEFTFELQLWLPSAPPNLWSWQTYATYTSTDGGPLMDATGEDEVDKGDDGILDFVVGTCGDEGVADQTFDWKFGGI
jgi:hypothetical protein